MSLRDGTYLRVTVRKTHVLQAAFGVRMHASLVRFKHVVPHQFGVQPLFVKEECSRTHMLVAGTNVMTQIYTLTHRHRG